MRCDVASSITLTLATRIDSRLYRSGLEQRMATVRMSPVTLTESRSTCDPSGPGWDWITVAAGIGVTGGASGSTLASSRVTPPVVAAPAVSSCVGFSFAVHAASAKAAAPASVNIFNCLKFLRSEEHTSELQSLKRISYAGFCLTQKKTRID